MISVTLPANYRCNDCGDLFYEPDTNYKRRGDYYHISEICPYCKSKNIEGIGLFTRLTTTQKGKM